MYTIRNVTESDAPLLRHLAKNCPPLDLHTQYTYWVIAGFFGGSSFLLEQDGEPVGYLTAVDAPSAVFIWQIGILEAHRGKKLSRLLIRAAVEYAQAVSKDLEVTIAPDNVPSYSAFRSFCDANGTPLKRLGVTEVSDLDDPSFREREVRYRFASSPN